MIIRSIPFKQNSNCLRGGKNSLLTDQVAGEQFCANCGYVISEKSQESGPEWRSFSQDEHGNRARAGSPTSLTMHDMGLSTVINPLNKDATGKPLSASMKSTITRLRTWDSRSQVQTTADRNLRQALNELNGLKDKLTLSANVLEKAAYLYRKALEKKLVRGRTISAIWSRFINFMPPIVATFSSTVLGFDKSKIIIPLFLSFMA